MDGEYCDRAQPSRHCATQRYAPHGSMGQGPANPLPPPRSRCTLRLPPHRPRHSPSSHLHLCPERIPVRSRPSRAATRARPYFAPPRVPRVPLLLTPAYWLSSFIPLLTRAWNELDPALRLLKKPSDFKTAVNNSSLPLSLLTLSVN